MNRISQHTHMSRRLFRLLGSRTSCCCTVRYQLSASCSAACAVVSRQRPAHYAPPRAPPTSRSGRRSDWATRCPERSSAKPLPVGAAASGQPRLRGRACAISMHTPSASRCMHQRGRNMRACAEREGRAREPRLTHVVLLWHRRCRMRRGHCHSPAGRRPAHHAPPRAPPTGRSGGRSNWAARCQWAAPTAQTCVRHQQAPSASRRRSSEAATGGRALSERAGQGEGAAAHARRVAEPPDSPVCLCCVPPPLVPHAPRSLSCRSRAPRPTSHAPQSTRRRRPVVVLVAPTYTMGDAWGSVSSCHSQQ